MLVDIHTHQLQSSSTDVLRVYNLPDLKHDISQGVDENRNLIIFSGGIHPWMASCLLNYKEDLLEPFLSNPRLVLIGEIGLDKRIDVYFDHQMRVFKRQLSIANNLRKPVIIHMVGTLSEMIKLKRNYTQIPAWIIHGFRGKKEMAQQCLSAGFYLSVGFNYQPEIFNDTGWMDHLFLETDDDGQIEPVYEMVADALHISVPSLEKQIETNFNTLFHT